MVRNLQAMYAQTSVLPSCGWIALSTNVVSYGPLPMGGLVCQHVLLIDRQALVVMDEVELPFGQVRLKLKGSAGGHNGLKSVEASLRTQEYPRYALVWRCGCEWIRVCFLHCWRIRDDGNMQ